MADLGEVAIPCTPYNRGMTTNTERHVSRRQLVIERADVAQLDRVRPLWQGMQEHHARIAVRVGEIRPIRSASSMG